MVELHALTNEIRKMAACLVIVPIRRNGNFSFSKSLSGKIFQMMGSRRKPTVSLTDAILGTGIAFIGGTDVLMLFLS